MNKTTTLQLDNAEFSSNEWAQHINPSETALSANLLYHTTHQDPVNLQLNWVHQHEVVAMPQRSFYVQLGKRIFDLMLAGLVAILILSWMIPLVGALILCESPGPILFIQPRSGRLGRPFRCLKFRTMWDAPTESLFKQTARDDIRITRLGRFLRKTNLDEMPQFLNVLVGNMSIVGPRPHAIPHDAKHWTSAAYRERYWVRPGITGLAQVRGARGATGHKQSMEHRVRYDHLYISRQTFLLDMKLCFRTLKLTFKGDSNAW